MGGRDLGYITRVSGRLGLAGGARGFLPARRPKTGFASKSDWAPTLDSGTWRCGTSRPAEPGPSAECDKWRLEREIYVEIGLL